MTAVSVTVKKPNFETATIPIASTAPLVMHKFSEKARKMMKAKQEAGSQATKGKKRDARDFSQEVKDAIHFAEDGGWAGIPASAFRAALIRACSLVNFKMTIAKMSVFILADGYSVDDATPLVKFKAKAYKVHETIGRTETGVAMPIVRPIWHEWKADLRIRWDADQFSAEDVINLLARAGEQVGILEGRPSSPNSNGMGWGTFEVAQ